MPSWYKTTNVDWKESFFYKYPKWLKRWQHWQARGVEITYLCADDRTEKSIDLELPSWPWRWVCWINRGHTASSYPKNGKEECLVCSKVYKLQET